LVQELQYNTKGRWFDFRLTPSHRIVALGSTQLVTEMIPTDISWSGEGSRCVGLPTLPPSCADCLEILRASTYWSPNKYYLLVNNKFDAQFFFVYIYSNFLHVSSTTVLIIRRINCINTVSSICHSM